MVRGGEGGGGGGGGGGLGQHVWAHEHVAEEGEAGILSDSSELVGDVLRRGSEGGRTQR